MYNGGGFYFADSGDLTHSVQSHARMLAGLEGREVRSVALTARGGPLLQVPPWWATIKSLYFWNEVMSKEFFDANLHEWIVPVIQGFVGIEPIQLNNQQCTIALISRRSRHRSGTRYKRRGIDDNGHAANFVETEEIITCGPQSLAFLIVRGAPRLPACGMAHGSCRLHPHILVAGARDPSVPARCARGAQARRHARGVSVPLPPLRRPISERFYREPGRAPRPRMGLPGGAASVHVTARQVIGRAFERQLQMSKPASVQYRYFDFHHECKGMRFENVSKLLAQVTHALKKFQFTWKDSSVWGL